MKNLTRACLLILTTFASLLRAADAPVFSDVFVAGKDGYAVYRIPSVVTAKDGTVLVFAEGRVNLRDHAENDIVLKRSSDGGATWGALQVVADDGSNALNNPCAVTLRESGRVLLVYQRYLKGFDEHKAEPGYDGDRVCRSFIVTSDDAGKTWSKPREITRGVKREALVTSNCSGPGVGIELQHGPHAGRVIIPFNQGPFGQWKVYAAYSDDHGETWKYGDVAADGSKGMGNEVQMVERADGSLLLNARSERGSRRRKAAASTDGGQTWTALTEIPELNEPQCCGSIFRMRLADGKSCLAYSGPDSEKARVNGTLWISTDEGATWATKRALMQGPFAYSCLTQTGAGRAGIVFETGVKGPYEKIAFGRLELGWLVDGK